MARNSRIKGITIEIGGDSTGLEKALKGVNKDISNTQMELKDVNRLLKLDPSNTELLAQKQRLLREAIAKTGEKLETLRDAEKQVQEQFKRGEVSQSAYDALKREIAETEQAEKNLNQELKNTSGSLEKQDSSMRKNIISAELMTEAIKAGAKAVVNMAKSAIEYNAQMESYLASFTSFLGDAETAEKAIANIKQDASNMTFGADKLIEANQLLITAGVGADEAREAVNALAESVAATGGGDAELSRMASNLQQIKNVGKATSMDIRQFANAGINVYGLLSDYTGKSAEDLKDMEITYEDLIGAMQMATQEGGRYYGAMAKQAETYNGQLNKLKSRIKESLGTTFEGVSKTLKEKVFPEINKALDSIDFEALGESIGKIVESVGDILPVVLPVVSTAINKIGEVLDAVRPLVDAISTISGLVVNMPSDYQGMWNSIDRINATFVRGFVQTLVNIANLLIDIHNFMQKFSGLPLSMQKLGAGNLPHISMADIFGTEGLHGAGNQGSLDYAPINWSSPSYNPAEGTTTTNTNGKPNFNNEITININGSNASPTEIATQVSNTLTKDLRRLDYAY